MRMILDDRTQHLLEGHVLQSDNRTTLQQVGKKETNENNTFRDSNSEEINSLLHVKESRSSVISAETNNLRLS